MLLQSFQIGPNVVTDPGYSSDTQTEGNHRYGAGCKWPP